jgi:hypothetical protein
VVIIHTKRLKKWQSFIERCLKSGYHPYKEVKKVVIIHRKMFKKWLSSIQKEVKKW